MPGNLQRPARRGRWAASATAPSASMSRHLLRLQDVERRDPNDARRIDGRLERSNGAGGETRTHTHKHDTRTIPHAPTPRLPQLRYHLSRPNLLFPLPNFHDGAAQSGTPISREPGVSALGSAVARFDRAGRQVSVWRQRNGLALMKNAKARKLAQIAKVVHI